MAVTGPVKTEPALAFMQGPALATVTPTPSEPAPTGDWVWVARLIDVQPNAVLGGGAIVRVYVQNESERIVELKQGELTLSGTTGTKPEYGPDAVEFAPVSPGRWFVWVPALGPGMALQTDDTSLFVVEFARVPAAQATAMAQAEATATPLGGQIWQGKQTVIAQGPSPVGVLLRVKVEGVSGLPVDVSTFTDFIGQSVTGNKPDDLPADVAEIAGLSPGTYTISPHGLNAQITLDLVANTTVLVEFNPVPPPSPTPTSTPLPPTATPRPTDTPSPTPTPKMRWVAAVTDRSEIKLDQPVVIIEVEGETGQTLSLTQAGASFEETCRTARLAGSAKNSCRINASGPGQYTLTWQEQTLSIPLQLNPAEAVWVNVFAENAPAGETVWQGQLAQNNNKPLPHGQENSQIRVQVANRKGQIVSLSNSRGNRWLCETGSNHQCVFKGLKAGVYAVIPANLDTVFRLYVDGVGQAQVNFAEIPAPVVTATPISGRGAIERKGEAAIGVIKATPTASNTPTRTPTSTITPVRRATATPLPPTSTATPLPTLTPTPAMAWIGQVAEQYSHPGQTLVVRAPLHLHPVLIQSGSWKTEGLTGTKPEHGEGAVEFSGLSSGNYIINLVGLGEFTVNLPADQFMVVQFNYQIAPTPTPTPVPGEWAGAVIKNTSGSEDGGGAWSIITIDVAGAVNHPVRVSTDGFETECITGSKPELGASVCQVGGLWPATYRVEPVGLPISLNVTLDGRGYADVAFWQQ